jgi:hypothetical protein
MKNTIKLTSLVLTLLAAGLYTGCKKADAAANGSTGPYRPDPNLAPLGTLPIA